jgi:predicted alpha/beta-hydrolase family hydrolase
MPAVKSLEVHGYQGRLVPNSFWKQPESSDHLAIILPGQGYGVDLPVLHYPARWMYLEGKADLMRVEYAYSRDPSYENLPALEKDRWLHEDALAGCKVGLEQGKYRKVTLIGKSLGTMAMAYLLEHEPRLSEATCIWLTPVLADIGVVRQLSSGIHASLVVIGTADPFYSEKLVHSLTAATNCEWIIIPGADHSLEVAGDLAGSMREFARVIERIGPFLHV